MLKHQGIVYHSCLPQLICTSTSAPAVSSMNRAVVCSALAFSSMFLMIWGLQSLVSLNTSLISLSTSDFEYQQLSLSKGRLLAFHKDLVLRLLYFTTSWHIAACSWCKQQASSASAFCEWNDLGSDLVWYWSWRSLLSLQESRVQMYRSCRGCQTCCHAGLRRPVRPKAAEHVLKLDPEVKQLRSTLNILNINTMNILIYPSEFFSKFFWIEGSLFCTTE